MYGIKVDQARYTNHFVPHVKLPWLRDTTLHPLYLMQYVRGHDFNLLSRSNHANLRTRGGTHARIGILGFQDMHGYVNPSDLFPRRATYFETRASPSYLREQLLIGLHHDPQGNSYLGR